MRLKFFFSLFYFLFSFFVFANPLLAKYKAGDSSSIDSFFLKNKEFHILTQNKGLLRSLNRHFKKKKISEKEIRKFLIRNSYFQSKILKEEGIYKIQNPVQTVFVFKGNQFFNKKEIQKLIKFDEIRITDSLSDLLESNIKSAYQRQGFQQIKIRQKTVKKKWKEWIYLDISEGHRIKIAELKIKGLLSQPAGYYESFIKNHSSSLIKKGFYSQKDLEQGYENLIHHLKSQGYLQSKIYSDRVFFQKDKAFINIFLEEGTRTLIRDIQIQNAKAIPLWEILSHIQSSVQLPLKMDLLWEDLNRIEELYQSKGYLNMKITNKDNIVQYQPGEKFVSVVISLEEGPRAVISKLIIKGLKKAKEQLVRSLLKFGPGDILTPSKKEQSVKALGKTELWTDINFSENWDNDRLELTVLLRERKARSLRGGLGINSQRGLSSRAYTEITARNLFGWGRAFIVRGEGQLNFTRQRALLEYEMSMQYKEVFIPQYGYQGDISWTQSKNVFKSFGRQVDFVKKDQVSFFINKNISENLKMKWNILSFENRREFCPPTVNCLQNSQQISSTNFHILWDKRDNIFDPSSGYFSSWTTEWASPVLGSNKGISFIKLDLQNQFYWTFMKSYDLRLGLKGGLIQLSKRGRQIPVSRAFILGGRNSIRAYDGHIEGERIPSKKLVPIAQANSTLEFEKKAVRQSLYGLLNIDFRFPIFENLKGVLFYDGGGVWLKTKASQVLDYGHAGGIGFRYQTFLIPIGLDIAYKLPPLPEQAKGYRVSFAIGW